VHRRLWIGVLLPLAAVAACVGPRSVQGPIRGGVALADAAERDDLVARLRCQGHGIHGAHTTDTESRVFGAGERFLFLWAWRGVSPAGCSVELLHPLYLMQHVQLEPRFALDLGRLELARWDAALAAAPEGLSIGDLHRHIFYLRYYYLPAFRDERARAGLARYVPGLHALYDQGLRTLPGMDLDRFGSNEDTLANLRAIEAAVGYARPPEQEALFAAAADGDAGRVRAALAAGADPDAWNAQHAAAIHLAAKAEHTEAVLALLDAGADADRQLEGLGDTALLLALQEHDARTALALLERGADPTLASRGTTPLRVAARNGMLDVVHALVERGALARAREERHRADALVAAAAEGHSEVVRALVAAGVAPDAGLPAWSALMHAARNGKLRAAQALLDAGADPRAVSDTGKTALGLAREHGRSELVALLEARGASAPSP
jgi:ankyrin repeat protein